MLEPAATCDALDIDEHALRRSVYLLERAGLIRRGPDVTLQASLTLLGAWDAVLPLAPAHTLALLSRLPVLLPNLAWSPERLTLAQVAAEITCAPAELERALISWSIAGGCLYRPWERGYQITRLVPPETPLGVITHDSSAAQEAKLDQMRTFVRDRTCRWQMLRAYFGDPEGPPCGHCDRCDPHQRYPWSERTGRDVPDVSDFLDLATTLLALADWNERRHRAGRAPFSMRSLVRILRGDEFALMRHSGPGKAADHRRVELRACPYWGVCRTLRRSASELERFLDRLIAEGYLATARVNLRDEGFYEYLTLTDRGHTQLQSGEHIGW